MTTWRLSDYLAPSLYSPLPTRILPVPAKSESPRREFNPCKTLDFEAAAPAVPPATPGCALEVAHSKEDTGNR